MGVGAGVGVGVRELDGPIVDVGVGVGVGVCACHLHSRVVQDSRLLEVHDDERRVGTGLERDLKSVTGAKEHQPLHGVSLLILVPRGRRDAD